MHYTSHQERREAEALNVSTASFVIPNALVPSSTTRLQGEFRKAHGLEHRPIVLFLSRLDEKKGIDLLLRAFVAVRRRIPEAALAIAGDGEGLFVRNAKARAETLGLEDVIWTGFLQGEEKEAALADADVFALPSYSENFGIAVAEAMAARLPVVVSDQVAIHEQVSHAQAGIVVPCDDSRLAEALVRLLHDRDLRREMGTRGQALARGRYSADAVTRQLIAIYDRVTQHQEPMTAMA